MNNSAYIVVRKLGYANDLDENGFLKLDSDSTQEIYSVCNSIKTAKEHIKTIKDETVELLEENNVKYEIKDMGKGSLFIITIDRKKTI